MKHPTSGLDDTVHQRNRLGILSVLADLGEVDFRLLRETLGLTDGNLSRHLLVLEEAGLVQTDKTFEARRPRTRLRITARGREALAKEIAALKELVRDVEATVVSKASHSGRRAAARPATA